MLLYAFILLLSFRKMWNEQLLDSVWMNLLAFALLWAYRLMSFHKITKIVKVDSRWVSAHAFVVVVHLGVLYFLYEPAINKQPIIKVEENSSKAPSKAYVPGDE